MNSPHKIITVTSLSHSGSTIFSMAMAGHQQLVSVGEVFQVLRKRPDVWLEDSAKYCSCGKHSSECEFWAPVLNALKSLPASETKYGHISAAYEIVARYFEEIFGADKYMVDTSKGLRHITVIQKSPLLTTQTIFLLRDVRAYACSQTRLAAKQNRKGLKKIKTQFWYHILRWYFGNRKREKLLKSTKTPYHTVGYDAFCFKVVPTLAKVYQNIGLSSTEQSAGLSNSQHHVLVGNPMRLEPGAHAEIRYDNRWFKETGYMLFLEMLPMIKRHNRIKVYAD